MSVSWALRGRMPSARHGVSGPRLASQPERLVVADVTVAPPVIMITAPFRRAVLRLLEVEVETSELCGCAGHGSEIGAGAGSPAGFPCVSTCPTLGVEAWSALIQPHYGRS